MMVSNLYRFRLALEKSGTGIFRVALNRMLPENWRLGKLLIYSQCVSRESTARPLAHHFANISTIRSNLDYLYPDLISAFPQQEFERRFRETGNECYVAHIDKEIVAYAWTVENAFYIDEINYWFTLREAECFIYDCFVQPGYRGKGIYPALLRAILQDKALRRPEVKLAYIGVVSENRSSRRGIVKAGFEAISSIGYISLGSMEKWWYRKL